MASPSLLPARSNHYALYITIKIEGLDFEPRLKRVSKRIDINRDDEEEAKKI